MFLIGIRVRPSSTVSWTGMSRIMLMSLPAVEPVVGAKFANGAGLTCSAGDCSSDAVSVRVCAAAAAQSALSCSSALGAGAVLSSGMVFSDPARLRAGQQLIDLEGVLAVRDAVVAREHRHAGDLGLHAALQFELDEVARREREQ